MTSDGQSRGTRGLKIGIEARALDAQKAGIGWYTHHLTQNLRRIAPENEYVLFRCGLPDRDSGAESGSRQRTARIPSFLPRSMAVTLWQNWILPRQVMEEKVDVLHCTDYLGSWLKPAKRLAVTIYDLCTFLHPRADTRLFRLKLWLLLPRTVKLADRIITVSESSRKALIQRFPSAEGKTVVIHAGVDASFQPLDRQQAIGQLQRNYDAGERFILFVGTLEPKKNLPVLIQAYALLREKHGLPHKLLIAGKKGWMYQEVFDTTRELGLENDVVFAGYVPWERLPLLYNAAEVFVYPSLCEGFGLPPLEAMACGTPVITSNVASLPEVVGDAGIMTGPHDVSELAEAIASVLNDPIRQADMRERGLEQARQFSWEKAAKETLDVYKEVCSVESSRASLRAPCEQREMPNGS